MLKILIRPERPSDIPAIHSLLNAAFQQNDEGLLVKELRATDRFIGEFSWVIEQAEVVIGYLLLYPIDIETGTGKLASLALAPMAVVPDQQRKGWGGKLVIHALNEANSKNWGSVIVLGHPQYYPRFGFKPASRWNITGPFEVPDEVFMAIELIPGSLSSGGRVVYPDAFMKF